MTESAQAPSAAPLVAETPAAAPAATQTVIVTQAPAPTPTVIVTQAPSPPPVTITKEAPSGVAQYGEWYHDKKYCNADIFANEQASCGFAYNVAEKWREEKSTVLYDVYSPATGLYYTVNCNSSETPVVCTGGRDPSNPAIVYVF